MSTELPSTPSLPPALSAPQRVIDTLAGRINLYVATPQDGAPSLPPLLLIHSVNAAASAAEVRPLFDHYRRERMVIAMELPGYGFSERGDRLYTPRLMTDAILDLTAYIRSQHPGQAIDALAASLSCEFLARAAVEQRETFRTLSLD